MADLRLFTVEEAEALLPRVRGELLAMQALKRQIDELRGDLSHAVETAAGNGHVAREREAGAKHERAERLVEQLNSRLEQLTALGCELKGLEEGLIDFPGEREGRVVYLCWKLGEERIAFWHELDTGFTGRQPL